jgi:toxin FitB
MIVLDTNVVSELMKSHPSRGVLAWLSAQRRDDLFTTTVTMAEILYGVELLPKGKRRDQLLRQAEDTFAEDFGSRVLSFDERAAYEYAQIASERRRLGRPISFSDAQIAAIARANGAALATRDVGDFEVSGLTLINPWEASS